MRMPFYFSTMGENLGVNRAHLRVECDVWKRVGHWVVIVPLMHTIRFIHIPTFYPYIPWWKKHIKKWETTFCTVSLQNIYGYIPSLFAINPMSPFIQESVTSEILLAHLPMAWMVAATKSLSELVT